MTLTHCLLLSGCNASLRAVRDISKSNPLQPPKSLSPGVPPPASSKAASSHPTPLSHTRAGTTLSRTLLSAPECSFTLLLLLPRLPESPHGFLTCCFLEMLRCSQPNVEHPPGLDGRAGGAGGLWYSVPPVPAPQLTHCLHPEAAAASSPAGKELPPHRAHRKHHGIYRA